MTDYLACSLCGNPTTFFEKTRKREYLRCEYCNSIQMNSKYYLTLDQEENRYKLHNNDIFDIRYQNFVKPIVDSVIQNNLTSELGLDFGAGTGPVITNILNTKGYNIEVYDPFFHKNENLLNKKYDFIIICEVIEHFHNPKKEFQLLKKLLKTNGKLYIMTDIFKPDIDFKKWHYKNDETHVFFYSKETFEYIRKTFLFSKVVLKDRLIIFEN